MEAKIIKRAAKLVFYGALAICWSHSMSVKAEENALSLLCSYKTVYTNEFGREVDKGDGVTEFDFDKKNKIAKYMELHGTTPATGIDPRFLGLDLSESSHAFRLHGFVKLEENTGGNGTIDITLTIDRTNGDFTGIARKFFKNREGEDVALVTRYNGTCVKNQFNKF
ncbi:hypothetical protein [Burkholderia multivorans]|uniref:hypothetical protein n=1 Tax=Burkholderia multivorans TaxID=87883 RepID=UPI0012D8DB23|nr:hypothetical protein [Burkholderia multivorans]